MLQHPQELAVSSQSALGRNDTGKLTKLSAGLGYDTKTSHISQHTQYNHYCGRGTLGIPFVLPVRGKKAKMITNEIRSLRKLLLIILPDWTSTQEQLEFFKLFQHLKCSNIGIVPWDKLLFHSCIRASPQHMKEYPNQIP